MGKVIMRQGIGYSEATGTRYIDMASVDAVAPARPMKRTIPKAELQALPWSPWGKNNLLPQEMIADIESTGILNGIIDGKMRFSACNGVLPAVCHYDIQGESVIRKIDKIIDDPEIKNFMEDNDCFFQLSGWMKDQNGFGNGVARFMLNDKRDYIAAFQRDDVTETRFAKKESSGNISHLWYSGDWSKTRSETDEGVFKIPLLKPNNPLADLRAKVEVGKDVEFAMTFKYPAWNKQYYSVPLWYAAYKWVKIAQGVPEMKAVLFENNMRVKYIVVIHESYWERNYQKEWKSWTAEQKQQAKEKLYDDIDKYLVGSKNAYKSIFTTAYRDRNGNVVPEIEIKPVDDTTKDGELIPDSANANSEIAFAMLFNPNIIGASLPSGPYTNSSGGSSVQEAVLLQIIIHELERQNVARVFNLIKRFNKWDEKFPGLEFIIPTTSYTNYYNANNKTAPVNNQPVKNGTESTNQ